MEDDTGEYAELTARMGAMGREPLDAALAARVLDRASPPRPGWLRSARAKVAAAAAGGFLVGSMGLASAGSLPGPAQQAAHSVLGSVGINVPPGQDRYNDPAVCPGGPYRNHGQYVRAHKGDPNAAQSPCGKPVKSLGNPGGSDDQEQPEAGDGSGQGNGPPPWAHGRGNGNKNKNKNKDKGGDEQPAQPSPATPAPAAPRPPTTAAPTTAAPTTAAPTAPPTTPAPPTTAAPATTTSTSITTSTSTSTTTSTASTTTVAP